MSTRIKTIEGVYQKGRKGTFEVEFKKAYLSLNRFWGGKEKGRMLQLTIVGETASYIQFTEEQVKELVEVLKDSFNDEKYPSE